MPYNCPKCHCGCLFEERGKLICLNCGAEVSKSAAQGVRHVHTYTTYRGKTPGKRQTVPKKPAPRVSAPRPAAVFRSAADGASRSPGSNSAFRSAADDTWSASSASRPTGSGSTFRSAGGPPPYGAKRVYQKAGGPPLRQNKKKQSTGCLIAILALVFLLVILPILVEVISFVAQDVQEAEWESVSSEDYEDTAWGVAYWYCYDGSLPDGLSEKLDELVYGYNNDHDLPQAEEVDAYLRENLSEEELEGYTFTCEQEGDDVCVTFYGAGVEDAEDMGDVEDWGVAYWYYNGDGSLPRELAETLDDIFLDYNIEHYYPDALEVTEYLKENLGDKFNDYAYTCEQDGNDVCVTFFATES